MKKVFLFSILTVVFTMSSIAQDKTSDLKKLFELMQSEKMVGEALDNMAPMLRQQASEKIKGSNSQEKLDKYVNFIKEGLKEISNELINKEMVNNYSENFTHEEIQDLIKFYESPTGKKVIEKTPELTKGLMNSMMSKYMPEFQEKLKQQMDELLKD